MFVFVYQLIEDREFVRGGAWQKGGLKRMDYLLRLWADSLQSIVLQRRLVTLLRRANRKGVAAFWCLAIRLNQQPYGISRRVTDRRF